MKQKKQAKTNWLPLAAAVVAAAAVLAVAIPKALPPEAGMGSSDAAPVYGEGAAVVIDTADLSAAASFYSYDVDGVTVELFAVEASDGSVRLALNTCQVCSGSPYAYFVQEGNDFICQNCHNRFSAGQVGVSGGGCNPVPIMEDSYSWLDGNIVIRPEFLESSAERFVNWKKF